MVIFTFLTVLAAQSSNENFTVALLHADVENMTLRSVISKSETKVERPRGRMAKLTGCLCPAWKIRDSDLLPELITSHSQNANRPFMILPGLSQFRGGH